MVKSFTFKMEEAQVRCLLSIYYRALCLTGPPKYSKYRMPCKLAWNFFKCQQS